MDTLNAILIDYQTDPAPMGAQEESINRGSLRSYLQHVLRRNQIFFRVYMSLVILVFSILFSLYMLEPAGIDSRLVWGLALCFPAWVYLMCRAWSEKASTQQMLILATHLRAEALQTVINVLASPVVTPRDFATLANADSNGLLTQALRRIA